MRHLLGALGVLALLPGLCAAQASGAMQQPVSGTDVAKNPELTAVRMEQHPGVQLPLTAQFKDSTGKTVTLGSLLNGRPVVLLPIFYRCTGVCGIELNGVLTALIKRPNLVPGRDLDIVVLSINPTETPDLAKGKKDSTLETYGQPKTAAAWNFLVGDAKNIRSVTDAMGFLYTYDAAKDQVNHPSCIAVLTPKGSVSTYMLGGTYDSAALQRDIERAAKEEIAAASQEQFFGCVHIDPLTGKRSIVIEGVVRLFGGITVAAVVTMLLVLTGRAKLRRA